jgi:tetratricopeptide (TPR) repeat protein
MPQLEPPDNFALSAALGWLELGNPTEALAELDRVTQANRSHSDVLELRWTAFAELKQWDRALLAASEMVGVHPDKASGWLHRAYALRRVAQGGLVQAWEALLPAADRFQQEVIIPFNLACYACQLQRVEEARIWLRRAMSVGGDTKVRRMALNDDDLKALWTEIREGTIS